MTPEESQEGRLYVREGRNYIAVEGEVSDHIVRLTRALESAQAEIAQLSEARRVVPELTEADWNSLMRAINPWNNKGFPAQVFTDWVRSKVQSIPANRVLKDGDVEKLIESRDEWEDLATKLAEKVGETFGIDVGEHSSANCPVRAALELLDERSPGGKAIVDAKEFSLLSQSFQLWEKEVDCQDVRDARMDVIFALTDLYEQRALRSAQAGEVKP